MTCAGFPARRPQAVRRRRQDPRRHLSHQPQEPRSAFHLSLGISYPNDIDRAFAGRGGQDAGGDIFIHGTYRRFAATVGLDRGCIAVKDREMEEIYAMVQPGTPILILP
jgi:murein L,D-transpeptidase YafK